MSRTPQPGGRPHSVLLARSLTTASCMCKTPIRLPERVIFNPSNCRCQCSALRKLRVAGREPSALKRRSSSIQLALCEARLRNGICGPGACVETITMIYMPSRTAQGIGIGFRVHRIDI